jgi:threonine synthase
MITELLKIDATTITIDYELTCNACRHPYNKYQLNSYCVQCGKSPIEVQFQLSPLIPKEVIIQGERSMWRYAKLLPLLHQSNRVGMDPNPEHGKDCQSFRFGQFVDQRRVF